MQKQYAYLNISSWCQQKLLISGNVNIFTSHPYSLKLRVKQFGQLSLHFSGLHLDMCDMHPTDTALKEEIFHPFYRFFLCMHLCMTVSQNTCALLFCAAHSCVWSRGAAPPGSPVWHKAAASGSLGLLSLPSDAYGPTSWLHGSMRQREESERRAMS